MDISKYKEALQNLSFLKNYASLLIPGAIGLAGVVVLTITLLMGGKLRAQMEDESIKQGRRVESLRKNVTPRIQHTIEAKYQEEHEKDANSIDLLARMSSKRQLLTDTVFPEPKEETTQIFQQFASQYLRATEALLDRINARGCPTAAEIEREKTKQKANVRRGRSRYGTTRQLSKEIVKVIIEDLCCSKAELASVYANPDDLGGYNFWKKAPTLGWDESIQNCWYAQLSYWIIEDIVDAIGASNSGSSNVYSSPVKRLTLVSFVNRMKKSRKSAFKKRRSRENENAENDAPSYILTEYEGIVPSCTRRISNDDLDVVHFTFTVVIRANSVLSFMQELCGVREHKLGSWAQQSQDLSKHNQITILESMIKPIERLDKEHEHYRYGEDAVVSLGLTCEYVFDRLGYDAIKPNFVKEAVAARQKEIDDKKNKLLKKLNRKRRGSGRAKTAEK